MFCPKCGANMPEGATFCTQCGCAMPVEEQAQQQTVPPQQQAPQAAPVQDADNVVKRVKDNAHLCAILWIVLGALQCLSCVGLIAGVWNIVIGVRELKFSDTIMGGNKAVYDAFDNNMTMLIVGAVINFVFGLLIGCALSAFEFYIRDQVLKNKTVFGA